ncbi:MAG: ABC transporter ATP-binding protein [Verrucomicrobiota bacterium]|nr:ABC transporter ATP-binding protein [Verrucomicrobiota bacterium]
MAKISIKKVPLTFSRGDHRATSRELDLEIDDREFVVLAGPAGCGHTSILRMIAGLDDIPTGEILIGERPVNDVRPEARDVAFVFRDGALYPNLDVRENIAFGLKLRKFSETEIERRVADAAAALAIEPLLARKPAGLTDDERIRVAFARAIAKRAKVYLCADPLSAVRGEARTVLRAQLRALHHRIQATIVYAAGDAVDALALGDRLVVMHDGAVEQSGLPAEVYGHPTNVFVAGFLGDPRMNFVPGTLKQERDALVFSESEGGTIVVRLPRSDGPAAENFVGGEVLLGVRPEDVRLVEFDKTGEHDAARFRGIAEGVEETGGEMRLWLNTGAHTLVCRTSGGFQAVNPGRRVQAELNVSKAHLFDPISGRRLL